MPARSGRSRLRRTWPQRLLILFNICCIAIALTGAGLVAYAKRTVSQIPRVTIAGSGIEPAKELEPGDPQNFLIVGVDSAETLDEDDPVNDGRDEVGGLRSDAIMVVRVDPKEEEAKILSFPRDLWVDIPGHAPNRINTAIQYGESSGPTLLIETIRANFGIAINHYVQVDFKGFKDVIAQIGGIQVYLANPIRDGRSGLNQPEAGCVTLDADQALAYARSRHLQFKEDGRWRKDPTSDLGRISRQQDFSKRVMKRAIEKGARNPATLRRMVESIPGSITLDQFTTAEDLINLGRTFSDFDPDELRSHPLPVVDVVRGGADVLDLVEEDAEPILELFRGTDTASGTEAELQPSQVTLRVLNGTGKPNQGADTTDRFAAVGFEVRSPGNDTETSYLRTEVRYRPGQEAQALLVARYLGADPALVPDESVPEITVITGEDLFTVLDQPRPADEIVTTTSTSTTSTTTSVPAGEAGPDGEIGTSTSTTTAPAADDGVPTRTPPGYLPVTDGPGASCG